MSRRIEDFATFQDPGLPRRYAGKRMPIGELMEAYVAGKVEIEGDLHEILSHRDDFCDSSMRSITKNQLRFIAERLLPEVAIHSKEQDKRIVRDHYDRGNDFFAAFLGPSMVYTGAYFLDRNDTLEQAQYQKLDLVCQKLQMKPGQKMLDLGAGWGTLVLHAAQKYGVDATGITIAENQVAFGNQRIAEAGMSHKARMLCMDYRDVPRQKYDKITCLEMSEHVGHRNYQKFLAQVKDMLTDDGMFYLQIAGPRRGGRAENLAFGLFMAKYIFPGADASRPMSWSIGQLEEAGMEVHSVENIGIHYSLTIKRWYDNWVRNKEEVSERYGGEWFRIFHWFLAWASNVAAHGQSAAWQIVANKNINSFDRTVWFGRPSLGEQDKAFGVKLGGDPAERPYLVKLPSDLETLAHVQAPAEAR